MSGGRTKSWFELCAQRNAELAEVKAAVGRGQDINTANEIGFKGLMKAALKKNHAILEWLLGRPDTDISLTESYQQNVFHLSCWVDNFVGLDRLLSHPDLKAGLNSKDLLGRTPLMCAVENKSRNCLKKLLLHPEVEFDTRDSQGRSLEEFIM